MTPELRALFTPDPGYLNTASLGVPPVSALRELRAVEDGWRRGRLEPPAFDDYVERARRAWARLSGVDWRNVATGTTVSQFVGVVAASLPEGARVVLPRGEFTSLIFPFLAHADRGVTVEEVEPDDLPAAAGRADLVAVSVVQSADGRIAEVETLVAAARAGGARLLFDTTQSCGWLPVDCSTIDFVVCGSYKWLLSPRGTAFMAVAPDALASLRPLAAGWYAGADPWTSLYGSPLRLAEEARRLDLSPAWFSWVGTAVAVELLVGLDPQAVHAHNVGLADRFLHGLGAESQRSAIVTVDVADASRRLADAGVRTAVRAGRVRASFHVYNDEADVDLAVAALTD